MLFRNRREAGRALAMEVARLRLPNAVILGLPRGGIPVGYEVALFLRAPLDVFVVRKLGVPGFEELAMGAIASGGVRVLNQNVLDGLAVPTHAVDAVVARERLELERRVLEYRRNRGPLVLTNQTVVLVDDGLATGATMRAAALAVRAFGPKRVVAAVPVGAPESLAALSELVNDVVSVAAPEGFDSVGAWYVDFTQTTDAEVRDLLTRSRFDGEGMSPVPGPS